MSRFAGIVYDGIRDPAARQAFRRLSEVMGNMFLTGAAADRPSSARLGAFYVCQDADNEVYWYAGPAIGWLQIHSDNSSGVPSVLHEKLSDLLGGAASDHYHITGAEHTALLSNYPWGPGGVIYVASGPALAVDASNFVWDAATGTLCIGTTDSIGNQGVLHAVREGMNYLTLTTYTSDYNFWRSVFRFRRAGGTEESPTAIGSGYWIGQLRGEGHDGSGFQAAGGIRLIADPSGGSWTGSDWGSYWTFYGVRPATTSQIELLRLRNGQVQLPAGSASLPALAWWNSTGMGFYRLADNRIGVALNGAKHLWFRGTGVLGQTPSASPSLSDGETAFDSDILAPVSHYKITRRLGGITDPVRPEHLIAPPSTSGSAHTAYTLKSGQWAIGRVWHFRIHGNYQIEGQGAGSTASLTYDLYVGSEKVATFTVSVGPSESTKRGGWSFDLVLSCDATGASDTIEAHCLIDVTGPTATAFGKGITVQATRKMSHVDEIYDVSTSADADVIVRVTANKSLSAVTWSRQRGLYPAIDVV